MLRQTDAHGAGNYAPDDISRHCRTDELVVGVSLGNIEDLPWAIHGALTILGDDKGAGEHEASDCEGMSMLSSWRASRLEILGCYLGEFIGFEPGL